MLLLTALASCGAYSAESASTLAEAVGGGDPSLKFRYRFEYVDQDDPSGKITRTAKASTVRTRLSYRTLPYHKVSAFLEFDNLTEVGADDYDDGAGRRPRYPVVADAAYTEVNQAYLDVGMLPDTLVRVGRQRVNLDNERFVGGVGWRQNEQTYDAVAVVNSSIPQTELLLAAVTNIKRINGDSLDLGTHKLFHAASTAIPYVNLSAYAYLLDGLNDSYGARLTQGAAAGNFIYTLEYARQESAGAPEYRADYLALEAGMKFPDAPLPLTVKAGYEVLGSDDGAYGFSTPVATLHPHNGWADKFLATPAEGLTDLRFSLATTLWGAGLKVVYHEFESEHGDIDLGSEIDAVASKKINENFSVMLKYARYESGDRAALADAEKFWLMVSAGFL